MFIFILVWVKWLSCNLNLVEYVIIQLLNNFLSLLRFKMVLNCWNSDIPNWIRVTICWIIAACTLVNFHSVVWVHFIFRLNFLVVLKIWKSLLEFESSYAMVQPKLLRHCYQIFVLLFVELSINIWKSVLFYLVISLIALSTYSMICCLKYLKVSSPLPAWHNVWTS